MENKEPTLVPEYREMLATGDSKALQDFCKSGHAAVVAKLIPAFSTKAARVRSRFQEMPCRIVFMPVGYPFHSVDRNRDEKGNPIVRRVAL
jgi:hypothetical protein